MNRHQSPEPDAIREKRLAGYYRRRTKGKIIIAAIGLAAILLLCLYQLFFKAADFSGNVPASRKLSTEKQALFWTKS